MRILRRFLRRPGPYFTKLKYYAAGLYFDYVQKVYQVGDCSFIVPLEYSGRADRGYFALGTYEKAECDVVSRVITSNCTVLELGGCIGVVSCVTNKLLKHPTRHVVVEANPNLIPFMIHNQKRNSCHFKVENCVIAFEREVDFFIGRTMVLGSLSRGSGTRIKVQGLTFSEIESRHALCFDTVIMDIEGGEYSLIKENVAFFARMKNVIMENHPSVVDGGRIREYESYLSGVGFTRAYDIGQVTAWQK